MGRSAAISGELDGSQRIVAIIAALTGGNICKDRHPFSHATDDENAEQAFTSRRQPSQVAISKSTPTSMLRNGHQNTSRATYVPGNNCRPNCNTTTRMAAAAIELGLVDELRMFRNPVVVGGGTPFLPPVTEDVRLDLVETRTFGSRVIYERYGRARDECGGAGSPAMA